MTPMMIFIMPLFRRGGTPWFRFCFLELDIAISSILLPMSGAHQYNDPP